MIKTYINIGKVSNVSSKRCYRRCHVAVLTIIYIFNAINIVAKTKLDRGLTHIPGRNVISVVSFATTSIIIYIESLQMGSKAALKSMKLKCSTKNSHLPFA